MATTTTPIPLSSIPTLPTLYKTSTLSSSSSPPRASANATHNGKISLIRTDLTTLAVDAIVNAANESLLGGGGVDGAIHRAAGPDLVRECRGLDGCATGAAKITRAYRLPCRRVIHAVGPVYHQQGRREAARLLAGCYTASLDLMVAAGCRSVAFSALSTGVYGYPSREAAEVALGAVRGWLDEDEGRAGMVERIVFCSFLEKDERAYEEMVPKFFPPAASESAEGENVDDAADGRDDEAAAIPDLPDVPTNEPTEPGQPEHKKPKLDSDEQK